MLFAFSFTNLIVDAFSGIGVLLLLGFLALNLASRLAPQKTEEAKGKAVATGIEALIRKFFGK